MVCRLLPLLLLAATAAAAAEPRLRLAATWESGAGVGDESLGYQAATRRLAVGNGRLGRVRVLSLEDSAAPRQRAPRVRAVQSLRRAGEGGRLAPEDLAYIRQDGAHYVATANEKSGTVSIVEIEF